MDYWNVPFNRIHNQKPGGCRDVQEEAIQLETNKVYGTIYVCVTWLYGWREKRVFGCMFWCVVY